MKRILIANRGEIASRIIGSCRTLGISTVAVHSDFDSDAPFVRDADVAVRIGGAPATESYLSIERIIEAAEHTGADAIHPGYGFLAENADFAEACAAAGLVFIGPSPDTIRRLGSKIEARKIATEAGVAVAPSFDLADESSIEYPLLIKASAGGGGKGMTIVRSQSELAGAIESARRIASQAFGDDALIGEKYIERPRHIEIQIVADAHGNTVHLFERECSVQRRYQKIVEESPAPGITAELRRALGEAAVKIAVAVGYRNAGTVEFIVAPDGAFYFLEVNTRLQVEHPVTELCTGVDLVAEQIRIARGQPLSFSQQDVRSEGHAIEVRLYAEDATNGFLPATGFVESWQPPDNVRVDAGIAAGSSIGVHYDPMLAKLIAHAPHRAAAIDKLDGALTKLIAFGVTTNRVFLRSVLRLERFVAGDVDTHLIEDSMAKLAEPKPTPQELDVALIAATLDMIRVARSGATVLPGLRPGYRTSRSQTQTVEFDFAGDKHTVAYRFDAPARASLSIEDRTYRTEVEAAPPGELVVRISGPATTAALAVRHRFDVATVSAACHVQNDLGRQITLQRVPRFSEGTSEPQTGECVAPMPGTVVDVKVAEGQSVEAGATLVVLEAMKMEHSVRAPQAGKITKLLVATGAQVAARELLVVVSPSESNPS